MDNYILDTFALMAYFQGESAGTAVKTLVARALDDEAILGASLVNAGELYYMTWRKRGASRADEVWADLQRLPITWYSANRARILAAARIKAMHHVSYADAFAIALAQELGSTVVTGDPEFKDVETIVPVMWL